MIGQSGSRKITYEETIAKLKEEMSGYVAAIKSTEVWPRLESAYRAMAAIEELAGDPRTTLEQTFNLTLPNLAAPPRSAATHLNAGEQQEPEAATELEKGA
jgi:hypothetical protein